MESRPGQREKLGCDAATSKASADHGSAGAGTKAGDQAFVCPLDHSWLKVSQEVCVRPWGRPLLQQRTIPGRCLPGRCHGQVLLKPEAGWRAQARSCCPVSPPLGISENVSKKKKTKINPEPTNLRKGLVPFWCTWSQSFISYRYT